ncbi:MAG: hypothetical protein GXP43_01020 [bacterium]|nr:hypothetical protein [bacterium]
MKSKPIKLSQVIFLIFLNIILSFTLFKQLKTTWQEYHNYTAQARLRQSVDQLIKINRRLQQDIILAQDPFYKEFQARNQLALGFPGEKTYLFPKPTFTPPPLVSIEIPQDKF